MRAGLAVLKRNRAAVGASLGAVVLVALFVPVLLSALSCAPRAGAASETGASAGAAIVPTEPVLMLTGERVPFGRVLQGRVTLASFWAPWCEACSKEVEALNRLAAGAAGRADALVIGVAVGEPHDKIDAFVRDHGVRYAQVVDEDFRLSDALGQRDVPGTLVIDRSGRVVYRGSALDADGLRAFRDALGER